MLTKLELYQIKKNLLVRASNWLANGFLKIQTPFLKEILLFPISGLESITTGNLKTRRIKNSFKLRSFEVGITAGKVGIGT